MLALTLRMVAFFTGFLACYSLAKGLLVYLEDGISVRKRMATLNQNKDFNIIFNNMINKDR